MLVGIVEIVTRFGFWWNRVGVITRPTWSPLSAHPCYNSKKAGQIKSLVWQRIFHSHEAVHATRAPCQPHPRSAGSSFHSFSTETAFGCVCVLAEQGQCIGSHSRAPGLSWPMTYMWSLQKKCLKEICSSHVQQARLAQSAERKALNLVVVGSSPTVGVLAVAFTSPCRF